VFEGATAFKQGIWCSQSWLEQPVKIAGLSAGNEVLCCYPGKYVIGQTAWTANVADRITKDDCTVCPQGRYTDKINLLSSCTACPEGWYQNEEAKQFCLPCLPGKYGTPSDQANCGACSIGQHRPSKDENGVATDLTKCK